MKLTANAAAKKWNITRQTIYNRMKEGALSYELNDNGKRVIEHSEMVRVFGEPGEGKKHRKLESTLPTSEQLLIDTLQEQLAIANRRIDTLENSLDDKDAKILELLRELQGDFSRFLEHQPTSRAEQKTRPEVIALPQDQEATETVQPPEHEVPPSAPAIAETPKPKKKRGLLQRVGVAIFDLE